MIEVKCFSLGLLQTNCYVVYDTDSKICVLIDVAYDCSRLIRFLSERHLDVAGVLLTHGHFDHCGGVKQIIQVFPEVRVYCHTDDCEMASLAGENEWGITCHNCFVTDKITSEGEITLGGFDFDCIFTPGHSAGSVCYLIDEHLFCGDTLFEGSIGRTDLQNSNAQDMVTSLKRIKKLTFDYVCHCGHGGQTTLNQEKQSNPYLRL